MSIGPRLFARPSRHRRKVNLPLAHRAANRQSMIRFVDRPQRVIKVPDCALRGAGEDAAGKSIKTLFPLAMAVVLGESLHLGLRLVTGHLFAHYEPCVKIFVRTSRT